MQTIILVILGFIIIGLIIQALGKAAGDEGAEGLGAGIAGVGKMGCGCMMWLVIIPIVALIILVFSGSGDKTTTERSLQAEPSPTPYKRHNQSLKTTSSNNQDLTLDDLRQKALKSSKSETISTGKSISHNLKAVINNILIADTNRSIQQASRFYANTIISNGKSITKNTFMQLMSEHFQRWPKVRWKMIGEPQISKTNYSNMYETTYKASYRVESPERNKWSEGKVLSTLKMFRTDDGSYLINQVDDSTYDVSNGKLY